MLPFGWYSPLASDLALVLTKEQLTDLVQLHFVLVSINKFSLIVLL